MRQGSLGMMSVANLYYNAEELCYVHECLLVNVSVAHKDKLSKCICACIDLHHVLVLFNCNELQ